MDQGRSHRILRQHVRTDALLGVDVVPLGEASGSPMIQEPEPAPVRNPARSHDPAPAPGFFATAERTNPPQVPAELDGKTKTKLLNELDVDHVRGCTLCELCQGRTQTVFGEGDPQARLMFIGEGPGQTEDELGRPFVGRAGEMLDKWIAAMELERKQVYIANVVKCRPPNNRAPLAGEAETCGQYLHRQIQIIRPRVIVTLGGPAAKWVLDTKRGVMSIRGTWHEYDGLLPQGPVIPVMPTFHPAYLLRSYTIENRKKIWADLQKVKAKLDEADGG